MNYSASPSASPIFEHLDPQQINAIVSRSTTETLDEGLQLITQNSHGGQIYLVLSGELAVTIENESGTVELGTIRAPTILGEMEWLTGEPRSASVTATSECEVLAIPFAVLDSLPEQDSRAAFFMTRNLARFLASRINSVNSKICAITRKPPNQATLKNLKEKLFGEWTV